MDWRSASLANRNPQRRLISFVQIALLVAATTPNLGTFHVVSAATDPAQVATLRAIASAFPSSNSFFNAWTGDDPCAASNSGWPGVSCESNGTGNHMVTSLTLQGLGLSGQLPPALFELTTLTSLDIALNPGLTGSIYSTIGSLSSLSMLDMHGCSLSGSIPATISLVKKLNFFAVNSNKLSGSIPRQVANLTDLFFFDITDNQISGPVPVQPGFDTCTNIAHLHLGRNQLSWLPGELGRLPKLIHLLVDNNRLNQTFPAGLSGSSSLLIIHLSNNTIQGRLPPSLNLPQLQDLSLHNCSMPPQPLLSLAGLPALCYLDLSRNNFQGSVPLALFSSHPELVTLNLANNHLSSNLPPALASANLSRLHSIILPDNNLTGPVPHLDTLPAIATISLYDNHFAWAPDVMLSNDNVTLQLYGNDLCVPYRPEVSTACSPPRDIMQYQPPLMCDHFSCPSLYAPSPPLFALSNVCVCVSPLEVELKLTAPQYAVFNDDLAKLLVERIAGSLSKNGISISTGQIAIVSIEGSILSPSSITTTIRFFPPPSSSSASSSDSSSSANSSSTWQPPDQPEEIREVFVWHKVVLGTDFGPYTVAGMYGPDSPPPPPAATSGGGGMSTAAIVGIVVGGVVTLAVIALLLVWLLVLRNKTKDLWTSADYKAIEGLQRLGVHRCKLKEIEDATQGFKTLLGEGGYGQM
ncbi:hypothetical protein CLOP_g23600 [Closterium sp. NIES-67]|nr:hypothetical protein CLOP_g23600 [Closterium sp. NIES-67]